jgi:High potential iron-sulfur protein
MGRSIRVTNELRGGLLVRQSSYLQKETGMANVKLTRRAVLGYGVQLSGVGVVIGALSACDNAKKKVVACADPNSLSDAENSLRKDRHYVEQSPDPTKTCSGCGFFKLDEDAGGCGRCEIFQGPANPKGHCDSWAAKQS